eukprot:gnl/MRDRNA2_/MRDRNA2_38964_c0_seq2.p1 gnl/MRDRNA2_/MRDRNA2_38964_c0~~gnl/MRDRNA2_/MRDRNA2_38964_c0_seq2.p1  ORF type:complete len:131 (+),score=38.79 gnl/MRDRNA2_/MRDRNA2_38964_c0_seq2:41-394(+)
MDLTKVDAAMEEQMATGKQTQGSVDTANTGGGGGDWANSRGADFDDAAPSGFGDLEDAGVTYSAPEPGAEAESPTPMGRTMSAKEEEDAVKRCCLTWLMILLIPVWQLKMEARLRKV